jgi:hypothetical protein
MSADFDLSDVQGGEKYQSAFYVYEELASAPSTSAPLAIVGQAIAEIHLGRLPEAEAALTAALEKYPTDVELIANSIVLNVLAGKQTEELESYVIPSPLRSNETMNLLLTFISRLAGYSRSSPRTPFSLTSRRRASSSILRRLSSLPRSPRRIICLLFHIFVVLFNPSQGSLSCLFMKRHDLSIFQLVFGFPICNWYEHRNNKTCLY